jgi:hypothetical protein
MLSISIAYDWLSGEHECVLSGEVFFMKPKGGDFEQTGKTEDKRQE